MQHVEEKPIEYIKDIRVGFDQRKLKYVEMTSTSGLVMKFGEQCPSIQSVLTDYGYGAIGGSFEGEEISSLGF